MPSTDPNALNEALKAGYPDGEFVAAYWDAYCAEQPEPLPIGPAFAVAVATSGDIVGRRTFLGRFASAIAGAVS